MKELSKIRLFNFIILIVGSDMSDEEVKIPNIISVDSPKRN